MSLGQTASYQLETGAVINSDNDSELQPRYGTYCSICIDEYWGKCMKSCRSTNNFHFGFFYMLAITCYHAMANQNVRRILSTSSRMAEEAVPVFHVDARPVPVLIRLLWFIVTKVRPPNQSFFRQPRDSFALGTNFYWLGHFPIPGDVAVWTFTCANLGAFDLNLDLTRRA